MRSRPREFVLKPLTKEGFLLLDREVTALDF